ncbi:restriction endonuclease subunit S [Yokenella regensburgei]|uniref:restriction endonuclease subunit S n=1 Tax=Yokenella regensburgei TaxID=158877 RepID=UPI0014333BCB|nr:restriction endonuclease subunit S [Yokenella regensburgei]QIU91502.1 restriction endonuclease subunit S [Yokenella regensburgei]
MSTKVKWTTSFPAHWDIVPAKRLFPESKTRAAEEDEQLSATQSYGVISQSEFMHLAGRKVVQLNTNQHLRKRVEIGDFVISMRSFQGGLERAWAAGGIRSSYVVLKPHPNLNLGYYQYFFKSTEYIQALQSTANFIRDGQDMSYQDFILIDLPLPPYNEQKIIAAFLNYEISRIDKLVAQQQQLIELLKEKRQAVISHAVTKGLNPDVPMKDSGVEWLGEVPAHWPMKKISWYFSAEKGKKGQLLTKEYCGSHPGIYPVYSGQTENNGTMGFIDSYEFNTEEDGVLFSTTVGAKAMSLNHLKGKFSLSQNCMIISPRNNNARIRFFFYHFQPLFQYERSLIPEHMQASFRMEDLYQYSIALPPKNEQLKIAKFLDHETAKIDNLIEKQQQQIELLQERRTALISAAVTGKIDVRDWFAPDTQDVEEPQEAIA